MSYTDNLLIQRLPADDMARLLAGCETVEWRLAEVVCEPGETVQHAYFPLSGTTVALVVRNGGGSGRGRWTSTC